MSPSVFPLWKASSHADLHLTSGEAELLRLQEGVKVHVKATEMNANEKSKRIKWIKKKKKKTISKSLPGAQADKARSQGCFLPGMSRRFPQAPVSA